MDEALRRAAARSREPDDEMILHAQRSTRATRWLYQFMKAEKRRLMVRKTAITIRIVSTSLLAWFATVPAKILEDLGIGDGGAERGALDDVEVLAGQLRDHDAQRLRQHHQEQHGQRGETERAGGVQCWPFGTASMALQHDLGDEGRGIDREPGPERRDGNSGGIWAPPVMLKPVSVGNSMCSIPAANSPTAASGKEQGLRAQAASALQRQPPDQRASGPGPRRKAGRGSKPGRP